MMYWSIDTWMTSRETCFLLVLFNIARSFQNVCDIISD